MINNVIDNTVNGDMNPSSDKESTINVNNGMNMPPGLTSLAALSCELLICPFSDHSAVVTTHSIPSRIPQVPGRWQLNVSLLHDSVFVSAVEIVWTSWRTQRGFLPPGLMGLGKGTYKGHCN